MPVLRSEVPSNALLHTKIIHVKICSGIEAHLRTLRALLIVLVIYEFYYKTFFKIKTFVYRTRTTIVPITSSIFCNQSVYD